jgi:alkanesulfonate monooxygenase
VNHKAAIKQRIAEVKAAAPPGKSLRFSVSLRPILGETEEKAWERANEILSRIQQTRE